MVDLAPAANMLPMNYLGVSRGRHFVPQQLRNASFGSHERSQLYSTICTKNDENILPHRHVFLPKQPLHWSREISHGVQEDFSFMEVPKPLVWCNRLLS